jgi:hypothetical protein
MLRKSNLVVGVRLALIAALLASPGATLAQRGAGGGHTGGGTAGGGGLSGGGIATGLSEKDDLKDFHLALAVQATSPQIVAYNLMIKSSDAANTALQTFVEHLSNQNGGSDAAALAAPLSQSIATARTENKKFLDALSEQQKSGLKEIIKRLTKADSDLEQQARPLTLVTGDTKAVAPPIAVSAQNLGVALTSFRSQQFTLGEEMSIGNSNRGQDSFELPMVRNTVAFASQSVAITTSGELTKNSSQDGQNTFKLELTADLSDLQQNLTDILRAQLDKSEPCGERIAIQSATLTPRVQVSVVAVQLHFERWSCPGREMMNEMVEGNGTIEVKLTPEVADDGSLRLLPEIGRVTGEGVVGESLRSGSLGESLRDKITESILSVLRQGDDFKTTLPAAAQGSATLQQAQFQGTGSGRLLFVLEGEIRVSNDKATALTAELKGRSTAPPSSPQSSPAATPR